MLDETTKRLLNDVANAASDVGRPAEHRRYLLEVVAVFDRCRSTFGAVRLLAERGFGQEALVLTRGLFSESLMLMEIAAADERRRAEIVLGWMLHGLDDLSGVMAEAEARGDDTSAQQAAMSAARRSIEESARGAGIRVRHWQVDEKRLAQTHGRDDYLDFRMGHHFVHGSSFAAAQRYSQDDEGQVAYVGGPAADTAWARPAALFAASSLVYATAAICTILGWPQPEALEELRERIESAGDEPHEVGA